MCEEKQEQDYGRLVWTGLRQPPRFQPHQSCSLCRLKCHIRPVARPIRKLPHHHVDGVTSAGGTSWSTQSVVSGPDGLPIPDAAAALGDGCRCRAHKP